MPPMATTPLVLSTLVEPVFVNAAVPFGTVGLDDQLAGLVQSLEPPTHVPSVACAVAAITAESEMPESSAIRSQRNRRNRPHQSPPIKSEAIATTCAISAAGGATLRRTRHP